VQGTPHPTAAQQATTRLRNSNQQGLDLISKLLHIRQTGS